MFNRWLSLHFDSVKPLVVDDAHGVLITASYAATDMKVLADLGPQPTYFDALAPLLNGALPVDSKVGLRFSAREDLQLRVNNDERRISCKLRAVLVGLRDRDVLPITLKLQVVASPLVLGALVSLLKTKVEVILECGQLDVFADPLGEAPHEAVERVIQEQTARQAQKTTRKRAPRLRHAVPHDDKRSEDDAAATRSRGSSRR